MIGPGGSLVALAKLAVRGMRSRGAADPLPLVPRRRLAVERREVVPRADRLRGYLRATDGTRIPALQGPDAVASPVYCATWETGATLELLTQVLEALPAGGIVHLESELLPLRPLRPGDHVRARVELERTERTEKGVRLLLTTRVWSAAEQLCSQSSATLLIRSRASATPRSGEARPEPADAEASGTVREELARWRLPSGAGRRYALASGDYNPIHLWGWTARPFGYRRPILHGFCIEARVAHALIEHRFRGDPTALRRLKIAFRAPLLLPARVRLLVGSEEGHGVFRVADEEGEKVYAEGEFVGG
ncbi:MAG TPA: MaoC/PaaZ C-terminal domain-containing protein [Longimicrobiaceae bacterium]|nr:MaoC/PaaZ C-terminal domain-containing protein [Longimicrobiaceae bacterium]